MIFAIIMKSDENVMKSDDRPKCYMFWCAGEQVPDGVLQPAQVQHGRPEEAEEAEDQESHPLIDLAAKPRFNNNYVSSDTSSLCDDVLLYIQQPTFEILGIRVFLYSCFIFIGSQEFFQSLYLAILLLLPLLPIDATGVT